MVLLRIGKKNSSASNSIPLDYVHVSAADSKLTSPGDGFRNQEYILSTPQGVLASPEGCDEYLYQPLLGYIHPHNYHHLRQDNF